MGVRIGIDVGGTFTDLVVLDENTREIIFKTKVPTTHSAPEGVAAGIIQAVRQAQAHAGPQISLIAHSTTQATNALLEGDVAAVGIMARGTGWLRLKAKLDTRIPPIELAPGRLLTSTHRFSSNGNMESQVHELQQEGCEVIVASEMFAVEDPAWEQTVVAFCRGHSIPATSGHEVSQLHGLRVRTRTAVLNAGILPRMLQTADMTEQSIRDAGVTAPLMIMRSDGGVMTLDEMRRRPILTMFSGPAAGVAGALLYERLSDGIFLEVGGTSTDISAIRDGQAIRRPARIGGHKTYLTTLDVRTLGVAGGSLISGDADHVQVGPRSAHIAGLPYAGFSDPRSLESGELHWLALPGEARPCAIICWKGGRAAVTPTCIANALGIIQEGTYAFGNLQSAGIAIDFLAEAWGMKTVAAGEAVLRAAVQPVARVVKALIREYRLEEDITTLVGGGGGAGAIVPFLAEVLQMQHRLASNAEYISTIGVAMALVRETVERHVINPDRAALVAIRREAEDAVIRLGARPDSVEVLIEVDRHRSIVRCSASGSVEMGNEPGFAPLQPAEALELASKSLRVTEEKVTLGADIGFFRLYHGLVETGNRRRSGTRQVRVIDGRGAVRLQRKNPLWLQTTSRQAAAAVLPIVEETMSYGDAGKMLPDLFVFCGKRMSNLSTLSDLDHVVALLELELEGYAEEEPVLIVATERSDIDVL